MINLPAPKERNLFLSKQVDQDSIVAIAKDIININQDDLILIDAYRAFGFAYIPKPIKLYLDTFGGSCYQCNGLVSVIQKSKTPVHTIVTGCAMSAGFYIAIAGHWRSAHDRSTLLYHQLLSWPDGPLQQIEEDVLQLKRLQASFEKFVLSRTLITKSMLHDLRIRKKDLWMTAKQAMKLKCIDEIL